MLQACEGAAPSDAYDGLVRTIADLSAKVEVSKAAIAAQEELLISWEAKLKRIQESNRVKLQLARSNLSGASPRGRRSLGRFSLGLPFIPESTRDRSPAAAADKVRGQVALLARSIADEAASVRRHFRLLRRAGGLRPACADAPAPRPGSASPRAPVPPLVGEARPVDSAVVALVPKSDEVPKFPEGPSSAERQLTALRAVSPRSRPGAPETIGDLLAALTPRSRPRPGAPQAADPSVPAWALPVAAGLRAEEPGAEAGPGFDIPAWARPIRPQRATGPAGQLSAVPPVPPVAPESCAARPPEVVHALALTPRASAPEGCDRPPKSRAPARPERGGASPRSPRATSVGTVPGGRAPAMCSGPSFGHGPQVR